MEINDALALKGADIGIAMGSGEHDVAKELQKLLLPNDNYITIAQGIFEGRKVFLINCKKELKYYLSVKVCLSTDFPPYLFLCGTPIWALPHQIIS